MNKKQSKPPSYSTVDVVVLVGVAVVALIVFRFHDGGGSGELAHADASTESAPTLAPEPASPQPEPASAATPEAPPPVARQELPPTPERAEQEPPASEQTNNICKPRCLPPWRCVRGQCLRPDELPVQPAPGAADEPSTNQPADLTAAASDEVEAAPSKKEEQGRCAPGQTECSDVGCVDLTSNPAHCGECGLSCSTLHQVGTRCVGGRCVGSGCLPGWGNCDDMSGCETNLTTAEHCGACFNACNWYTVGNQRKRGRCVAGKCVRPKFD